LIHSLGYVRETTTTLTVCSFFSPLSSCLFVSFCLYAVVHMKGRGGSGDGRVVFARIYSGKLQDRDVVQVVSPPALGDEQQQERTHARTERIGGMLELAGGRFDNLPHGTICKSGDVCALIGLKSVVTGDTILMASSDKKKKNRKSNNSSSSSSSSKNHHQNKPVFLAGVSSPKPVLTVRLEAETAQEETRLMEALALLTIEDPSLVVEATDAATLLSGLGELHIEVTLDRLQRDFGINVMVGTPSVTYRETICKKLDSNGLIVYDRMIGDTARLQAGIHLVLEPTYSRQVDEETCVILSDPTVTIGPLAREFLNLDPDDSEEEMASRGGKAAVAAEMVKAIVQGCKGALKRGPRGAFPMANVHCHVVQVDAEDGLAALEAMPGSLRAAAQHAVSTLLTNNLDHSTILEPNMSIEVTLPNDMVGTVLSDLTSRGGSISDVFVADTPTQAKALVRGQVPLVQILGYANSLRSLTGGEAAFTAEYKGHSPSQT
jgi:elongation factor G